MGVAESRLAASKSLGRAAAALATVLACVLSFVFAAGAYADDASREPLEAVSSPAGATEAETGAAATGEPALPDGVYVFRSKLSSAKYAIDLKKDSAADNIAACLRKRSVSLSQRLCIRYQGDGSYSMQVANSGKYLAEVDGHIVQRGCEPSLPLPDSQKWIVRESGGYMSLENVATGMSMTAATSGKARDKTAMKPEVPVGKASQLFRPVRVKQLIESGVYTLTSNAKPIRLDVKGASWSEGAKAQVRTPSKSISQKFVIHSVGKGCYRISMAVSGSTLRAKAKKGASARVGMTRRGGKAGSLLWKASIGPNGIVLTNKATGGALTAAKAKSGSAVLTGPDSGKALQGWRLSNAKLKVGTADNLKTLLTKMSADASHAIKLDAKGTGFALSAAQKQKLRGALGEAWKRGEAVGFVMVDLETGITMSVGADRDNHGASTFKAAYVTYIYQSLIEKGAVSYGSVESLMSATIGQSSNEAYAALRDRFGTGGFRSWLDSVGLGYLAGNPYPRLTARKLALVWSKIYAYEESGGKYVSRWRNMFNHSYYSCIREQLSGANKVYSKPGWYPKTDGLDALNDAAIVKSKRGKGSYLLAILSSTNCYNEQWIVRNVAKQLDAIHAKMPRKLA